MLRLWSHLRGAWPHVRRGLLAGLLVVLMVVNVAVLIALLTPKEYRATATIEIPVKDLSGPYFVQTYCSFIQSDAILRRVATSLNLRQRWAKKRSTSRPLDEASTLALIRRKLHIQPRRLTRLINIHFDDESPEEAAAVANKITSTFVASQAGADARLIQAAAIPRFPVRPNILFNLMLGIVVGGLLGCLTGVVVVLLSLRRTHASVRALAPLVSKTERIWIAVTVLSLFPVLVLLGNIVAQRPTARESVKPLSGPATPTNERTVRTSVQSKFTTAKPSLVDNASALQIRLVARTGTNEPAELLPDITGRRQYRVLRQVLLDGSAIAKAGIDFAPDGQRCVIAQFTTNGTRRFAQITATNIHRQIAIVFRGQVLTAPMITGAVPGPQVQIFGPVSSEWIHTFVDILNHAAVPTAGAWSFTPPRERDLLAIVPPVFAHGRLVQMPNPTRSCLNLHSGTVVTNQSVDWESRAGHDWISTNGIDLVAEVSSKHLPVLTGLDIVVTPAPSNGWTRVTATDVVQDWTLGQMEPQQEKSFDAIPDKSDCYLFQTREGDRGILQILGVTNDGHAVRLRYKMVRKRGSESSRQRAVPPSAAKELPRLRFLAWQGEWKTNCAQAAYHPDGSLVTNVTELRWLRAVPPSGCEVTGPKGRTVPPRFLYLWFSHPWFDRRSLIDVTLLDQAGRPIQLGTNSMIASGSQLPSRKNGELGWLRYTIGPVVARPLLRQSQISLSYAIGSWEKPVTVAPNNRGMVALSGDSQLNGIGQGANGKAFVALAIDTRQNESRQFGVVAVTKDGWQLEPAGWGKGGFQGQPVGIERFEFDAPLTDIAHFRIGTRPVRKIVWMVTLPP